MGLTGEQVDGSGVENIKNQGQIDRGGGWCFLRWESMLVLCLMSLDEGLIQDVGGAWGLFCGRGLSHSVGMSAGASVSLKSRGVLVLLLGRVWRSVSWVSEQHPGLCDHF